MTSRRFLTALAVGVTLAAGACGQGVDGAASPDAPEPTSVVPTSTQPPAPVTTTAVVPAPPSGSFDIGDGRQLYLHCQGSGGPSTSTPASPRSRPRRRWPTSPSPC